MGAIWKVGSQSGSAVLALVLAIVIGIGAALGLSAGLVSVGSGATQVNKPLVSYNSP